MSTGLRAKMSPNPSVKASPNSCARKARLGQTYQRPIRALTRSAVGPALPRTLGLAIEALHSSYRTCHRRNTRLQARASSHVR